MGVDETTEYLDSWKFTQWFRKLPGEEENLAIARNYELTALEFDKSGNFLASGDRSGTVVVLKNDPEKADMEQKKTHFGLYSEITSHKQEFDFLISKPIEPGITALKWGPQTNDSQYLLTTNTKQIRLWKLQERETFSFTNFNLPPKQEEILHQGPKGNSFKLPKLSLSSRKIKETTEIKSLKVPSFVKEPKDVVCDMKRNYFKTSHRVFISQLAVANDQETFLSADSLSINQWSLYRDDICCSLVDLAPHGVQGITEILLSLDHHPESNHLFLYGTSKGKLNLCDMRVKALADKPIKSFNGLKKPVQTSPMANLEEQVMVDEASMFDEVTSGITGMQFSGGGRFIITRDYMSIKIWDMNYGRRPIETLYVHEFLRPRLFELHEHNRTWQDNFKITVSPSGNIATGTYSNYFHIFDLGKKKDLFIRASQQPEAVADISRMNKRKKVSYLHPADEDYPLPSQNKKKWLPGIFGGKSKSKEKNESLVREYPFHLPFQNIDFNKKAAQICWHPEHDVIAVAGENNLYMYSSTK